jgi:hypothetical protein
MDDDGNLRSFFVDNEKYKESIHRRASCRGCHTSITEVPHKKNYTKVTCGISCHLTSTMYVGGYSHSKTFDAFMTSAHGVISDDTPSCLYCHPKNLLTSEKKMSRFEIVATCSGCHIDNLKMSGYGIMPDIVKTYQNSEHGKIFFLEENSGAICTDCHSVHNISKKELETSPVNEKNLYNTCAGKETEMKGCHIVSNPDYIYSFNHEKDKEAGIITAGKVDGFINYMMLAFFYSFCIINIFKIIRD